MDIPSWVPVACMAIGIATVLRAAFIVTTKSTGRFRGTRTTLRSRRINAVIRQPC